ncbi:P-loop containing nucleoside triphosphate hydrolase protein [Mycena vulgaris]|nr:P-loop containing nucleoside triphosphate hydrolase protein [Mycena vulgaris]
MVQLRQVGLTARSAPTTILRSSFIVRTPPSRQRKSSPSRSFILSRILVSCTHLRLLGLCSGSFNAGILLRLGAIFGQLAVTVSETRRGPPVCFHKAKRRWPTDTVDWDLTCEYVEADDDATAAAQRFGLATHSITIENFDGTRKITALTAYPLKHHPAAERIRQKIIARGRKWSNLHGAHHKQYNGLASRRSERGRLVVRVDGRIMIDRGTFARSEPGYSRSTPRKGLLGLLWDEMEDDEPRREKSNLSSVTVEDLKEDDLLMATPIVYGFSLTAKRWSGKGGGLIMNLFGTLHCFAGGIQFEHSTGPPGVGKTLTVEATSEHLRKPLYIVSAGDLGTDPTTLDGALTKIFSLVPGWDAVVLIDEADVFLEERGTADVERNAMVAVFLRQLEYFPGILFLTTNRVKQFDAAFQSRIHLSLRYNDLSRIEKEQLWQALSTRNLNGRQIKNIVKLAVALAAEEKESPTYAHLVRTIGISDDWGSGVPVTPPSGAISWVTVGLVFLFCLVAVGLVCRK